MDPRNFFRRPPGTTGKLLAAIAEIGPSAGLWCSTQQVTAQTASALCQMGMTALDQLPPAEAKAVSSLILDALVRKAPHSNAARLARVGLVLLSNPREFSLTRDLYKTFEEIATVPEQLAPTEVFARLGNKLTVAGARALLGYMADLKELESRVRLLAREGAQSDAPHPRLVLATMLKTLPERLSPGCSANLREGVLVMRLIDEIQPLAPAM